MLPDRSDTHVTVSLSSPLLKSFRRMKYLISLSISSSSLDLLGSMDFATISLLENGDMLSDVVGAGASTGAGVW